VNSITGNEHQLLMNIVIKNSTGDKADALPSMAVCYQCIQSIIECFDICYIIEINSETDCIKKVSLCRLFVKGSLDQNKSNKIKTLI